MDGTPTSRMNDWMLRSVEAGKIDPGTPSKETLPGPQLLEFELSEADKTAISDAQRHHRDLMSKRALSVLQVDAYGKDVIKQFKVSPDSWAQLTMQVSDRALPGTSPSLTVIPSSHISSSRATLRRPTSRPRRASTDSAGPK